MEDIRKNPDVKRVVAEMRGSGEFELEVSSCKSIVYPDITMSIGDLAFWMRDKCDWQTFEKALSSTADGRIAWFNTTPEQWIYATVKAWNSKAADAAGDRQ